MRIPRAPLVLGACAWIAMALPGCGFSFTNPLEACATANGCHDGAVPSSTPDAGAPQADGDGAAPEPDAARGAAPSAAFEFVDGDYTLRRDPQLHIVGSADVTYIMLSETSVFRDAQWQPLQSDLSYTFPGDGVHYLYLKAKNSEGRESPPVLRSITVDSEPRVTLLAPSGATADSRPELTWTASWIRGATYIVELAATMDFVSPIERRSGLADPRYSIATPLPARATYYWRVAIESQGHQWMWTLASFRVDLGSVLLTAPAADLVTNQRSPTFEWTANSHAATYVLALGTTHDLSDAVRTSGIAGTSTTLSAPLPPSPRATYYWAITPVDENGIVGTPSDTRGFVLDTEAPTGTIVLEGGKASTYRELVDVALAAIDPSGVSEMYLSKDGTFADDAWRPLATSTMLNYVALAAVETATITAHVRFRDRAGNVSLDQTDSIALARTLVNSQLVSSGAEWSAAHGPYVVRADVVFDVGTSLVIGEGTEVFFDSGTRLEIRGGLSAVGTTAAPIVMHGAQIDWNGPSSGTPSFNPDGSYASGPRFENVQMPDGGIHVPQLGTFYLRNCSVARITSGSQVRGAYVEHSVIDDIESDGSFVNLPWGGAYVGMPGSRLFNSYVKTLWVFGDLDMRRCRVGSFHWWPGTSEIAFNDFGAVLLAEVVAMLHLHDNNIDSSESTLFAIEHTRGNINPVDATGNYWGAAVTAEMQSGVANIPEIHDIFDDATLVRIDFAGFLSTPVAGAGPDW